MADIVWLKRQRYAVFVTDLFILTLAVWLHHVLVIDLRKWSSGAGCINLYKTALQSNSTPSDKKQSQQYDTERMISVFYHKLEI